MGANARTLETHILHLLFNKYWLAFRMFRAILLYSIVKLVGKLSKYCAYDELVFDNWMREFEMLSSILCVNEGKIEFKKVVKNGHWSRFFVILLANYVFRRSYENFAKLMACIKSCSVNVIFSVSANVLL